MTDSMEQAVKKERSASLEDNKRSNSQAIPTSRQAQLLRQVL